ncbi:hypothetical protein HanRHA438_Chr09g0418311 [Helianthus annuus]|nr:hypothetical protein HanRHA438_Chr09g0418311 [Helianthus annuus]
MNRIMVDPPIVGNREVILTTFGKRIILCKAERCEIHVGKATPPHSMIHGGWSGLNHDYHKPSFETKTY